MTGAAFPVEVAPLRARSADARRRVAHGPTERNLVVRLTPVVETSLTTTNVLVPKKP